MSQTVCVFQLRSRELSSPRCRPRPKFVAVAHRLMTLDPGLRRDDAYCHRQPMSSFPRKREPNVVHISTTLDPGLRRDEAAIVDAKAGPRCYGRPGAGRGPSCRMQRVRLRNWDPGLRRDDASVSNRAAATPCALGRLRHFIASILSQSALEYPIDSNDTFFMIASLKEVLSTAVTVSPFFRNSSANSPSRFWMSAVALAAATCVTWVKICFS